MSEKFIFIVHECDILINYIGIVKEDYQFYRLGGNIDSYKYEIKEDINNIRIKEILERIF